MMANILSWFLHGKEVLTSIPKSWRVEGGGHGERNSRLYFETHSNVTLERIYEGPEMPSIYFDY
jgi:hypothetical protein